MMVGIVCTDRIGNHLELISFLNDELDYSNFPIRTGDHIESRPGGINFSILGRGEGDMNGREEYVKWDRNTGERILIADRIKNQFPDLNVQIGGQQDLIYLIVIRVK